MASGKAMGKPGRNRRDADAEVEAKIRELSAKIADLNNQAERVLVAIRWFPYFVGLVVFFGLAAIVTEILF